MKRLYKINTRPDGEGDWLRNSFGDPCWGSLAEADIWSANGLAECIEKEKAVTDQAKRFGGHVIVFEATCNND